MYYYSEAWNPLLSEAEVKDNILSVDGRSVEFKNKTDNLQYYDDGFIVPANCEQTCGDNYLALYSVSRECGLRWKPADYTKSGLLCERGGFKAFYSRIETFEIKGDFIFANTVDGLRLKIDGKTGITAEFSSFAWLK